MPKNQHSSLCSCEMLMSHATTIVAKHMAFVEIRPVWGISLALGALLFGDGADMTVCVMPLSSVSLMISFSFVFWMPALISTISELWQPPRDVKKIASWCFHDSLVRGACCILCDYMTKLKIFHGFLNNAWCIIYMSNFLGIFVNDEWMYNFEHQIVSSFETPRSSPLCRFPAVSFVIWRKIRIILAHAAHLCGVLSTMAMRPMGSILLYLAFHYFPQAEEGKSSRWREKSNCSAHLTSFVNCFWHVFKEIWFIIKCFHI